ncbi:DUF5977 domain-containing protein [Pedobacter frigoris]|uniref:DUF5977 domain-containing protein n=1 Tax=Pedobacter frigoris TaxID=2571272 RepID=A0A4U1CCB6_9SPHI|nr:DUF5977 domain-containing protein [Pedobacter frigoris]TKC02812.1 hypothetical protein FA047_20110 [Pedobacter frigoris]
MSNSYLKIVVVLLCLCISLNADAQSTVNENFVPKSPNAEMADKFIDVPVNLANGIPEISIPLYTVKGKSLSVPLVLRYHGGGIKTSDRSTWVGLGWDLQTGGTISRTVRSNPDEGLNVRLNYLFPAIKNNFYPAHRINLQPPFIVPDGYTAEPKKRDETYAALYNLGITGGYYMDLSPLNHMSLPYNTLLSMANTSNANPIGNTFAENLHTGLIDMEPDVFSLSTPDVTGKFMLTPDRKFKMSPMNESVKIGANRTIETQTYTHKPPYSQYIDSMLVNKFVNWKIDTDNGRTYIFGSKGTSFGQDESRYAIKSFATTTDWGLDKIVDRNTKDSIVFSYTQSSISGFEFDSRGGVPQIPSTRVLSVGNGRRVDGQKIFLTQKISSDFENAEFFTSYGLLDSIIIKDNENVLKRKIVFNYHSFQSSLRSKLEALTIYGEDRVTNLGTYNFKYCDTLFTPRIIGSDTTHYISGARDYWGYYNHRLVPDAAMVGSGNTDYKPQWPYVMLESLTGITYPTGAHAEFKYEPNKYGSQYDSPYFDSTQNPLDSLVGGIRIKEIITTDTKTSQVMSRSYDYTYDGGFSSGYLNIPPSFYQRFPFSYCTAGWAYMVSSFNKESQITNAPVIQYNRVTEINKVGADLNGYTEYQYFTSDNTPDSTFYSNYSISKPVYDGYGNFPDMYAKHESNNLLAGQIKSKKVFDKNGQQLLEETYEYASKASADKFSFFKYQTEDVRNICNFYTVPPPGGPPPAILMHYLNYYYEIPKYVYLKNKFVKQLNASGDLVSTTEKSFYESPYHNNMTKSVSLGSKADSTTTRYVYAFDCADVISSDNSFLLLKKRYYNPLISTYQFKNANLGSSEVNYYKNYGISPDTALYPVSVSKFESNAPQSVSVSPLLTYPVSILQLDGNYVNAINYDYNAKGTLLKQSLDYGAVNSYVWDQKEMALLAKATNALPADIAFTSFESSGNGGWTVGSSTRNSGGLTGSKSYNLTSGSVSKSGLNSAKSYQLSYWIQSTSPLSVTGTVGSAGKKNAVQGWTCFEHLITGVTSVSLSGSGVIDELRILPEDAAMAGYTYNNDLKLKSEVGTNNKPTYYDYDAVGRLLAVKDQNLNVIKRNDYNFNENPIPSHIYWNAAVSDTARRNNCSSGYTGSIVTYTVPANTYSSTHNQSAANALAYAQVQANKQAYANSNGSCSIVYYSAEAYQNYDKTGCSSPNKATRVSYIVPAGKYTSIISQADANSQATNDISTNGATYGAANAQCLSTTNCKQVTLKNMSGSGVTFTIEFISSTGIRTREVFPASGTKTFYLPNGGYGAAVTIGGTGSDELLMKINGSATSWFNNTTNGVGVVSPGLEIEFLGVLD